MLINYLQFTLLARIQEFIGKSCLDQKVVKRAVPALLRDEITSSLGELW